MRASRGTGAALEHFSVRLHKERARRQYEQYGEREATQGKPLKNALEDRTSANTVCPAALSVWHTALPIKPFAPVTRIFILQFYFLLEDRKRQTDELHIYPGNMRANLPDRPNLCLSMPRLENPLRPGCADWQRQCRLKNWAICEATLLSSGVCLKVSGRKKRAAMRRKSRV